MAPADGPGARWSATLRDDYGLTASRVLVGVGADGPLVPVATATYPAGTTAIELDAVLDLKPEASAARRQRPRAGGGDRQPRPGRRRRAADDAVGRVHRSSSATPRWPPAEQRDQADQLRAILTAMLKDQRALNVSGGGLERPATPGGCRASAGGRPTLRDRMKHTADTFAFDESNRVVQKALLVLSLNPAADAVDTAAALAREKDAGAAGDAVGVSCRPTSGGSRRRWKACSRCWSPRPSRRRAPPPGPGDQLASREQLSKLDEQLKAFMKEQQRLLDQTAVAGQAAGRQLGRPNDRKLAAELQQSQDKLGRVHEVDAERLLEAGRAGHGQRVDGQGGAGDLLRGDDGRRRAAAAGGGDRRPGRGERAGVGQGAVVQPGAVAEQRPPDRQQWTQEELPTKSDTPMPELPKDLQDMVGELMEQQEDLFQQMEDMNANITDSADKGIGWDAADGPIADMSAKGVTGNALPNNNEMGGRSGEGRSRPQPGRDGRRHRRRQGRPEHAHAAGPDRLPAGRRSRTRARTPSAARPAAAR